MNRSLIEQIFDRITTELPEFKKYGLFNEDFDKSDDGSGRGINFPAIFLSFPEDITFQDNGAGVQKTDEFIIRFHIAMKIVSEKKVLEVFDLKQSVYSVFHRFTPEGFSTMSRVSENTDEDRRNYYVYIQDYTIKGVDDTKFVCKELATVDPVSLELNSDLIIEPETVSNIRTSNEINR